MTKRDLALRLLRQAGKRGVTTGEFLHAGVGSRYGARLRELRLRGAVIKPTRVREGEWRYTLVQDVRASGATVEIASRLGQTGQPSRAGAESGEPQETLFPTAGLNKRNAALEDAA